MSWLTRLLLAALSGLSAWPVASLPGPQDVRNLLSGAIFGVLVLVPFLDAPWAQIGRAIALVAGSMVIHSIAVKVAVSLVWQHVPARIAMAMAGLIGALLVAALAQAAIPLRAGWKLWAYASLAGIAGGVVLDLLLDTDRDAVAAAGFAAWQMLVCLALHLGATGSLRARSSA
jgi:hypothetical protein